MWRFKPFMHKEPAGLEGRVIDVGNLKVNVQKAIAEGGFSCVYLARDAVNLSKQYAVKHMICNDEESLELVKKEISVMKSLRGHPNVVTLYAHTIFDMGRTKEAFLVMEFCEKSLVNVLESRGAGYFDENQVLLIFRDLSNAVFAMHCQSPPIAHRDLKAENLLLSSHGLWKLCDFGSTSTNHKRFEMPEEMGIEEDNIRKYTTPAYRAPEMWDLFMRELINEKVDIWALGCLLFRICYFKSAFDGESKLQVLNGNYRIPDLPKYSSSVTDLIRDMLQAKPDDRPDITQVWFRVNEQLPSNLQKSLPDPPPELASSNNHEGSSKPAPRRVAPPPPLYGEPKNTSHASKGGESGDQLGAFWSTMHVKDSVAPKKGNPIFDEGPFSYHISSKHNRTHAENNQLPKNVSTNEVIHDNERRLSSSMENKASFQDQAFNTFVAEFDTNKLNSGFSNKNSEREEALETELEKLREQLKAVNKEKAEITSKYEKLSAICRSQRQEIQDLKQTFAARTPSPNRETLGTSPGFPSSAAVREKIGGTAGEHQQARTPNSEPSSWGFETYSFTAASSGSQQMPRSATEGSISQAFDETKASESKSTSQPAGWGAGF